MKPTILLINFQNQQKLRKLKMALLPFKIRLKNCRTPGLWSANRISGRSERGFPGTDSVSTDSSGADGEGNADPCRNHGESV